MEFLVIILSGLLGFVAPVGFALDTAIESNIRRRMVDAEVINVRIDNTPTHQLLGGKVDRLRLATRGLEPVAGLRIAVLELETDPLDADIDRLRNGGDFRTAFRKPLQGAMRLVLTEEDLNRALSSPLLRDRLQQAVATIASNVPGSGQETYQLTEINLDFLEEERVVLKVSLEGAEASDRVDLEITTGLEITGGYSLKLVQPEILLNDRPLPPFLSGVVSGTVGERLDLRSLEASGITLRLLQLELEADSLQLAAFVRIDPQNLPALEIEE